MPKGSRGPNVLPVDQLYVARLEPIIIVWLWCVGACTGSFLNVAVFRLPRRCLSVMRPARSFCPGCRHAIPWYENIPLLSWLVLRARCSGCSMPIHWRYPLVELVTMLFFGWLAWRSKSFLYPFLLHWLINIFVILTAMGIIAWPFSP